MKKDFRDRLRKLQKGLSLSDVWPWKPHKGKPVDVVITEEPCYANWAVLKGLNLDKEAEMKLSYEYDRYMQNKNDVTDFFSDCGYI